MLALMVYPMVPVLSWQINPLLQVPRVHNIETYENELQNPARPGGPPGAFSGGLTNKENTELALWDEMAS